MAPKRMPTALEEIAERLRLSREALDFNITTIARLIGSDASTWHNYEKAIRRISLDKALLLKARTGISIEWVYSGDINSLPDHLRDKIQARIVAKKREL
jgi:transcriptional regulator with XRE-family HTH domain